MKIYTRRGDEGHTDLFGGPRVAKDHLRVEAYGSVDELNSVLGMAAAETGHADLRALCRSLQEVLFALGAYLASPDAERRSRSQIPEPKQADVDELEQRIDALQAELAPLQRFVLPGGTRAAATFHLARTVCRRAERRSVALCHEEPLAPLVLQFLNRLSDLLFILARVENQRSGVGDVEWVGRER